MKKLLLVVLALSSSISAQAAIINVGGVHWDPEQGLAFPALTDFVANGTIFEDVAVNPGDIVTGRGEVTHVNSAVTNQGIFCPGCELTFHFEMELVSFVGAPTGVGGSIDGDFTFKDLVIDFMVDDTPEFDGTMPTATDGDLWLRLALPFGEFLTGTGDNLGSGSDSGTGTALMDVMGGLAAANFDTNTQAGGADMVLSSSFQPTAGDPNTLNGTFDLTGNSIAVPEPSALALLGAAFLGFVRLFGRRSTEQV
ncbi:PEP-CTERM sorting domain-containing protein [Flocculibacter collagenilyticus]|uniref:PEP-CTERM sorting domain-containing protein n=1 Tax=Flocculibacter collagenilyticus TaxID=2744479 RepID=UPI0018F42716|nr:PEP-CTERM sorting domain-containing protein [Flocculibacter collagenilyticus]